MRIVIKSINKPPLAAPDLPEDSNFNYDWNFDATFGKKTYKKHSFIITSAAPAVVKSKKSLLWKILRIYRIFILGLRLNYIKTAKRARII